MKKLIGLTFCLCAVFVGTTQAQNDTISVAPIRESIKVIVGEVEKIITYVGENKVLENEAAVDSLEEEIESAIDKLDDVSDKVDNDRGDIEVHLGKGDNDDEDDDDDKDDKGSDATKSALIFGFGLNNWDFGGTTPTGYVAPNVGKSWFIDLGMQYRTRIGGEKSPVGLRYGYGFIFNKYDLDNNTVSVNNDTASFTSLGTDRTYNSKLRTSRVYVPLMLDFRLAKKMYLAVGGYAGMRLCSGNTRIEYDQDGDDYKNVDRTDLKINRFNYGLMASIGKNNLKVYGRYDLTEQFDSKGPQGINPWSVGLLLDL